MVQKNKLIKHLILKIIPSLMNTAPPIISAKQNLLWLLVSIVLITISNLVINRSDLNKQLVPSFQIVGVVSFRGCLFLFSYLDYIIA